MPEAADTVIAAAREFLGERITTNATLRDHHSHGQDTQPPVLPDAVAFIETSEEATRLLALCHAEHVPAVAWGAGTSLEGHVTPVRGGITLDLSHMTRIIEVSQADMDCRVEAGVTRDQLNEHLRDQGLFFPVDPGTSLCTIGGMCATRASGTNAVRYGTMRENVLGLTVAMADGRLIHTGGRVRKSATGYDLTRLFIGSEGTLGIITEIQLRLHGIPEAMSSATCQFPTLRGAVETVIAILQTGIPVARMELLTRCRWRRASPIRSWKASMHCPACSSNSMAAPPRLPNRQSRRRRSPRASTVRASAGRPMRPNAASYGRRGMMRCGRAWR
jgi:D-lactate dehydrogenase (cytochrome)